MLETDSVSAAASSLGNIASQISSLSSNVSGYDTSCEDGFDFAGAKSVIAGNIDACSTKVQNTISIMENVVSSHTSLQSSLQFNGTTTTDSSANTNGTTNNSTNTNTSNTSNNIGSTGNYTGGSYTGASYTGGAVGASYVGGATYSTRPSSSSSTQQQATTNTEGDKIVENVTTDINKVGYVYIDPSKVSSASKELLKNVSYKDGYAYIDKRLVIACDESVGKVGDIIRFTQKDGTILECVVGVNTVSSQYKNAISFIIEKDGASKLKEKDEIKNLISNKKTVERITTRTNNTSTTEFHTVSGNTVTNGNVIDTSQPVGQGTKYNYSDDDLAHLAYVAMREQGSVEGAKLELSLMANLYEKNKNKYSSVRDYVDHSGWFASGSRTGYTYPGNSYVEVARDVLNNGNRYLNSNVVEHDCISDLISSSTGSVSDRSSYIPGKTVLRNRYGARYVFVGFAPNGGDPFGYLV